MKEISDAMNSNQLSNQMNQTNSFHLSEPVGAESSNSVMLCIHKQFSSVREIVLNRPEKRNALTLQMWKQIQDCIEICEADPSVRVVVLRGIDASAFTAGADISEFPALRSNQSLAQAHKQVTDGVTHSLATTRPLTVAAIQGICYGGGLQLATACDLRIADSSAKFAVTPVKLGFVYGPYETQLLTRLVGEARAKEMLYTGSPIDAMQALRDGFIHRLSDDSLHFDEFLHRYVYELLQAAPKAQQKTKEMFALLNGPYEDNFARMQTLVQNALAEDEYQEGVRAFIKKVRPSYAVDENRSDESTNE